MTKSVSLLRVFGIDIRADLSWLLAFGAIMWSLGGYYFPATYPELNGLDAWTLALAVTTFLYVSIAAHELGHSLVSTRLGMPVKTITLFVFGGMAHLPQEPRRARDEFMVAVAGPITSLLLALIFGSLHWLGAGLVGVKIAAFGNWVGMANLSLGLFNLIPGLPLDGGRVLRALIWRITGNYKQASKISAAFGQMAALGLMGWGTVLILGGGWGHGLWMVLIGWYLQKASSQIASLTALRLALSGMTVGEIMHSDGPVAAPAMTLNRLIDELAIPSGLDWFPVAFGGRVIGMITVAEIKATDQANRDRITVGMTMKRLHDLPSVHPEMDAYEAFEIMDRDHSNQIVVTNGSEWLGAVTREGIIAIWKLRSSLGKNRQGT